MLETEITGLTAKELNEKYPALGGYKIICRLITEGTLRPYKVIEALGDNSYLVRWINYSVFAPDRRNILGKPVGDIVISACDQFPYDGPYIFDPSEVVFKTSDFSKLFKGYPEIGSSKEALFSIDPESGEIIHEKQTTPLSDAQPEVGSFDVFWVFSERDEFKKGLDEAHKEIKRLQRELNELRQGKNDADKTQAARDKAAENTAKAWMKRLEVAVMLAALLNEKWIHRKGNEPWANEGFTNAEISEMAESQGGLSQNALRAFKKAFTRSYPDTLLKTGSGARRS